MINQSQYNTAVERAVEILKKAGIVISPEEQARLEVADYGLCDLERTGLEILTYINTKRVCAKEIVVFPRQTCPEHWHPTIDSNPGKEETFRCRWGTVWLYVPGNPTKSLACRPPKGSEAYYTVQHEVRLDPGDQYTIHPDTPHWFQAGDEGAVVSEFSTHSDDHQSQYTDPRIKRIPEIVAD